MAAKKRWLYMAGDSGCLDQPTATDSAAVAVTAASASSNNEEEPAMPPKKRLMLQLKHKESQKKRVSLSEYYKKKVGDPPEANVDSDILGDGSADVIGDGDIIGDSDVIGYGDVICEGSGDVIGDGDVIGEGSGDAIIGEATARGYAACDDDMDLVGYDEDSVSAVSGFALETPAPVADELGEATDAREFVLMHHRRRHRQHRDSNSLGHRGEESSQSKLSDSGHRTLGNTRVRSSQRHKHRHHHHHKSRHQHRQHDPAAAVGRHGNGETPPEQASRARHQSRSARAFDGFVERQMQKMRERQAAKARAAATGQQLRRQLELREGEKVQRAESFLYGDAADPASSLPGHHVVPVSNAFIDRVVGVTAAVASGSSGGLTSSAVKQQQAAAAKPQISSVLGGIVRLVANSLDSVQRKLEQQQQDLLLLGRQQPQQQQPQQQQQQQKPTANVPFLGVAGYGTVQQQVAPATATAAKESRTPSTDLTGRRQRGK